MQIPGLFVANTGFDLPVGTEVTVYNVGSSPAATLNSTNFGQIDFLLVGREWWHKILSVALRSGQVQACSPVADPF